MVLRDFEITGFRTFDHLRLDDLSDVNLLVGENNVGKTTVLEALRLYLTEDWSLMMHLLEAREEFSFRRGRKKGYRVTRLGPLAFESLFHGRPASEVGSFFCLGTSPGPRLTVGLSWLRRIEDASNASVRYVVEGQLSPENEENLRLGFSIDFHNRTLIPIDYFDGPSRPKSSITSDRSVAYLPHAGLSPRDLGRIWDTVALTEDEDIVINALRKVVPALDKLVLVLSPREVYRSSRESEERLFMAKLRDFDEPVPFKSLGDGIFHFLGVVLGLASARDGVLLADEVETGLHFSVQAEFWRVVLDLAKAWNVQVFATTHSWDCVRGLQQAASTGGPDKASASLHRIERRKTGFKVVRFSAEEIAIADREDIEIR